MNLNGRRVLVTAGGSGIGLEIAKQFKLQGAEVFVSDIDSGTLAKLKGEDSSYHVAVADVSSEADVQSLLGEVKKKLGGLDILVNNAGVAGPTGPVEKIEKADWDRTFAVNITGQFLCVKYGLDMLRAGNAPSIVNLSSAAGRLGFAGRSPYSASKWAVVGFTKSLAIELGPHGIRVNAICPGAVAGPRIQAVIAAKAQMLGKPVSEMENTYKQQASLNRMVTAEDIANMVVFVASDLAKNISGQALAVDGNTEKLF
ncbi:MAG: SDR family oxidoreductase [Paralcaligenes sp.]